MKTLVWVARATRPCLQRFNIYGGACAPCIWMQWLSACKAGTEPFKLSSILFHRSKVLLPGRYVGPPPPIKDQWLPTKPSVSWRSNLDTLWNYFSLSIVSPVAYIYNTGWPRKNATTLIVNFINIIDETECFFILFGRTFIYQQNGTMVISSG